MLMQEPIDLFVEERTLDAIHRSTLFDAAKNLNPPLWPTCGRTCDHGRLDLRNGDSATPIRLLHGKMPILGWRFMWMLQEQP